MELNLNIYCLNNVWMITLQDISLNFRPIYGSTRDEVIEKLEKDGDSYLCIPGAKCLYIDGFQPKVRVI